MIDTHYDLLSIAYVSYLKDDYSYLDKVCKYFNEYNVKGVIANLYFMTTQEMKTELHPDYFKEDVSVLDMFKISKKVLEERISNTDIIYSIEGCDFLEEKDLEPLYKEGLRNILLVWNNENRYGSGNRSEKGLTKEGKSFLEKAISLGISIDLSHANQQTFYDMVEFIKVQQLQGKDVTVIASHSNARSLCQRDRNLTLEQLKAIKSINGKVGVFSHNCFIINDITAPKEKQREKYVQHIQYISSIIGQDNTMVATDDMDFDKQFDPIYEKTQIYNYETINTEMFNSLNKVYSKEKCIKFMYSNALEIFKKLK